MTGNKPGKDLSGSLGEIVEYILDFADTYREFTFTVSDLEEVGGEALSTENIREILNRLLHSSAVSSILKNSIADTVTVQFY